MIRQSRLARAIASPRMSTIIFGGGLDLVTPPMQVSPGMLRECQNLELDINGGYKTLEGYERFDGQTAPSSATYYILGVTITGSLEVDDEVTGVTSSATGTIIAIANDATYGDYIVITKVTGTFQDAETLNVSASPEATTTSTADQGAASTAALNATYLNLAADDYRDDITAVPGSGEVLGVFRYNAVTYAFRNNAGDTAADLYKSSASGWTQVALGRELSFTSGGLEYATGSVELTGGASGSVDSITVNSVEIMSGAESFDSDLSTTATAVAANITANTSSPNYTAEAVGAVITITAVTGGTGPNGFAVSSSATTITTSDTNMASGVDATEIAEGDTITGATSGATAVITRAVYETGTVGSGNAAGRLIFASQTGTFQSENLTVSGVNLATIGGNSSAITLTKGGSYKTFIHNFGGASGTRRVYGCDGVNRGWEFDGTVFVPIDTGMDTSDYGDNPDRVWAHKNHLFFSFGASVQHSGIGKPYVWSVILGAAELAVGDTVTNFSTESGSEGGGALGIFSRNSIHILYGSSSADWQLVKFREDMGAFADSLQSIGSTILLDDRGILSFRQSQAFGNFVGTTLSELIQPFINTRKTTVKGSCISRAKSQYRVFFNDKTAVYATFKGSKLMGMCSEALSHKVTCIVSEEGSSGDDEIFFGSDDGFVYQMDKGTSFDGDAIEVFGFTQYIHLKTPRLQKKWLSCSLEIDGEGYHEFQVGHEFTYGSPFVSQGSLQAENFSLTRWDVSVFDEFTWDGVQISPKRFTLSGVSENIGLIFYSSSDEFYPIKVTAAVLRYNNRRYKR